MMDDLNSVLKQLSEKRKKNNYHVEKKDETPMIVKVNKMKPKKGRKKK